VSVGDAVKGIGDGKVSNCAITSIAVLASFAHTGLDAEIRFIMRSFEICHRGQSNKVRNFSKYH
jgi:hypothetical protein